MTKQSQAAISMLFLCCGAALCGCGSDTATSPGGDASAFTITSDKVFVVDDHADLAFAGEIDSVLVFDMSGVRPYIPRGAIIVGTDNGGYIREVKRTAVQGARLFVTVSAGYLADAVKVGRIDTSLALGFRSLPRGAIARGGAAPDAAPFDGAGSAGITKAADIRFAPGVSLEGGGLTLSGTTLFSGVVEGSDLSVTITQGRIEFDPVLDLYASFGLGSLTVLRAVAEGQIAFTGDARIVSDGPAVFAREVPLASVRTTIVQRIGRVPVVVSITLNYVASVEVDLESATTCELGVEAVSRVKFGHRYQRHEWSCVAEASPQFVAHPFRYDAAGPGSVRLTVMPRIDVAFYGVPGISLGLGLDFGLIEEDAGFPVLAWETFASMRGAMTARSGALDRRISPMDCDRRVSRSMLASGPFRTDDYIFIAQWGNEGPAEGQFAFPKGIAVDAAGNVYVTDNWNCCVQKFTADGDSLTRWGTFGAGEGQFDSPENIAADGDGFIYVVDSGNNRVQKFTSEGVFVSAWGSDGEGDGAFRAPVGVAVSGGVVYITDGGNNRVQKFSTSGEFLGAWGGFGAEPGQFNGPAGIAVHPNGGSVLVADCRNNRIQSFSPDGTYLVSWGGSGTGDGEFDCVVDVAVAIDDAVLAVDLGNDRFQRFSLGGLFEAKLGTTGAGEGQLDHPEAIAIDRGGNVYVVDARNRRVQKFAPRIN